MATKKTRSAAPAAAKKATTKTRTPRGNRTPAKPAPAPEAARRGPSAETLEFAAEVVRLRDVEGLAWKSVAERLGVGYDHNGSSRLRRAYTLGAGKTVGVRAARAAEASETAKASAAKAPAKRASRKAPAKAKRETASERRARLSAESAKSGTKARTARTSRAKAAKVA